MEMTPSGGDDFYRNLPKVELHRHLEGSLRVSTLQALAEAYQLPLPKGGELQQMVQMQEDEPFNMVSFLAKFQTLRQFYLSPEIIQRLTYEVISDACADGIRYMELMFTPVALSRVRGFGLGEVMDWVIDSVDQANASLDTRVQLIVSVNRHESPALAEEVARLAVERIPRGIVALNLAGNEADFPADAFINIFRAARQDGLAVTIHAGEWAGAANVRQAIEELQAERIGHGIRVLEDADVVALARERGIAFEVCITSNYHTGVTPSLMHHPLNQMFAAGLKVVLNTDDPGVSGITLSDEYRLACETLSVPHWRLKQSILDAVEASFLPPAEKDALLSRFKKELDWKT
ncbi:MAG: adenosine deaminase [Anaerolineae bacterium]|nr:adenosine deaminase [Anaerolineae bacterium]